jgi:hypothetical protein
MTMNVGSAVVKAEAISYGAIKVSVRHSCGHTGTYVLHTAEQARLAPGDGPAAARGRSVHRPQISEGCGR